jgi:hypothetical protein
MSKKMPNGQIRMPKESLSPNSQCAKHRPSGIAHSFGVIGHPLVISHWGFFGHWAFVIGHFTWLLPHY